MRSLVGPLLDRIGGNGNAPVPYTNRGLSIASAFRGAAIGDNREAQAAAYGANGTLFAIVAGIATSVSAVEWRLWATAPTGRHDDREPVDRHAALDVWNHPNDFMSGQEYREIVEQHVGLTGEGYNLFARDRRVPWPIELWPVYPHRMSPVPSAKRFLAGYLYRSPDGEEIPLETTDVALMRQPHPLDLLRGLGVVAAISVDLESARESGEWNRNFFRNSAQPGGIIEFPQSLTDDEFDDFRDRWRSAHQGVANAHRVAMIENGGKWVDRSYSMRDMQFVELRGVSREAIREAYRYPVAMLGESKDVNRATADAQQAIYARDILVPRLDRWKGMLNHRFLPAFGPTAEGLEFDYESPVPGDEEAEDRERTSKADASRVYIESGWAPESVKEALRLPDALVWQGRPDPALAPGRAPAASADSTWRHLATHLAGEQPRPLAEIPPELARIQADWTAALDALLADWQAMADGQRSSLVDAVLASVTAGDLAGLATLSVSSAAQTDLLAQAMADMAGVASRRLVAEADDQGVSVDPVLYTAGGFAAAAEAAAGLAATALALSAGREALRWAGYGRTAREVADGVDALLGGLSDAPVRTSLGGSLTWAQNAARLETLRHAPVARYTASEVLDTNTCGPCREVDGREFGGLEVAMLAYGGGGYLGCLGTIRCRGTLIATWEDQ